MSSYDESASADDQIKVHYQTRTGGTSKAYVSESTLEGTDQHSDKPVRLEWDEQTGTYSDVDTRNWDYNMWTGEWTVVYDA